MAAALKFFLGQDAAAAGEEEWGREGGGDSMTLLCLCVWRGPDRGEEGAAISMPWRIQQRIIPQMPQGLSHKRRMWQLGLSHHLPPHFPLPSPPLSLSVRPYLPPTSPAESNMQHFAHAYTDDDDDEEEDDDDGGGGGGGNKGGGSSGNNKGITAVAAPTKEEVYKAMHKVSQSVSAVGSSQQATV